MTLKVTVSIAEGQPFKAQVHTQDSAPHNGPAKPVERHVIAPGESKDFYIHSSRSLYVHELPLDAA